MWTIKIVIWAKAWLVVSRILRSWVLIQLKTRICVHVLLNCVVLCKLRPCDDSSTLLRRSSINLCRKMFENLTQHFYRKILGSDCDITLKSTHIRHVVLANISRYLKVQFVHWTVIWTTRIVFGDIPLRSGKAIKCPPHRTMTIDTLVGLFCFIRHTVSQL